MKQLFKIFFLLFIVNFTWAQEGTEVQRRDFEPTEWRRATEGMDYSNDIVKTRKPRENSNRQGGSNQQQRPFRFGGDASPILKTLVIILLAVALFFLIRSLLGLNHPKNKAVKPVLSVEELEQLEDNLHQADLDDFINRALTQGNFALAVRLYYLAILKELSLQHHIQWKKDKTNRDYLREMNRTAMADAFSEITLIFERIWYGNIILQRNEFEQIAPKFKNFIHQIKNSTTPVAS